MGLALITRPKRAFAPPLALSFRLAFQQRALSLRGRGVRARETRRTVSGTTSVQFVQGRRITCRFGVAVFARVKRTLSRALSRRTMCNGCL